MSGGPVAGSALDVETPTQVAQALAGGTQPQPPSEVRGGLRRVQGSKPRPSSTMSGVPVIGAREGHHDPAGPGVLPDVGQGAWATRWRATSTVVGSEVTSPSAWRWRRAGALRQAVEGAVQCRLREPGVGQVTPVPGATTLRDSSESLLGRGLDLPRGLARVSGVASRASPSPSTGSTRRIGRARRGCRWLSRVRSPEHRIHAGQKPVRHAESPIRQPP